METLAQTLASLLIALQTLSMQQHPAPAAPRALHAEAQTATLTIDAAGRDATTTFAVSTPISLLAAMRSLASTTPLRFSALEYPGMGAFVESIGTTRNGNGQYWILLVNGIKASRGASAIILAPGDRAEWHYERGY